jgi:hypothetical protein
VEPRLAAAKPRSPADPVPAEPRSN